MSEQGIVRVNCCGNCKFARATRSAGLLECHRYPPVVTALLIPRGPSQAEIQFPAAFPTVQESHECGEHKPALVLAAAF